MVEGPLPAAAFAVPVPVVHCEAPMLPLLEKVLSVEGDPPPPPPVVSVPRSEGEWVGVALPPPPFPRCGDALQMGEEEETKVALPPPPPSPLLPVAHAVYEMLGVEDCDPVL